MRDGRASRRRLEAPWVESPDAAADPSGTPNLRERRRGELVEQIHRIALHKFDEHGYENTSLKEISDEAGISLRTLFRHFRSKDAILARGSQIREQQILARLSQRPIEEDLTESYLYAIRPLLEDLVADTDNALRDLRLVEEVPTLRAQYLIPSGQHQTDAMDREYARRLGCSVEDGRMRLLRCTLVIAMLQATSTWTRGGRRADLHAVVRSYLELLDPVVERIRSSPKGATARRRGSAEC